MEGEISRGAMLGIVLIALAAIIGLGFGIFAIAKGVANEGTTNVQDQLSQVSLATFNDFDQKVVTGTQVMSAYSNFAGKPYAILIATRSYLDGNTEGLSKAPVVYTNVKIETSDEEDEDEDEDDVKIGTPDDYDGYLKFLNYNALLGPAKDAEDNEGAVVVLEYSNGIFIQKSPFLMDKSGKIRYNTVTDKLSKSGQVEYVPSTARFEANLIKDPSGTIMGIAFQQVSVN